MAFQQGMRLLVAALAFSQAHGVSESANRAGLRGASSVVSEMGDIPKPLLDAKMNPAIATAGTIGTVPAAKATDSQQSFQSTKAQDSQKCRLMKLPRDLSLTPQYSSWSSFQGQWTMANNVILSTWKQNLFTQWWHTVYFQNTVDGGNSFKAIVMTDNELKHGFNWQAAAAKKNSTNIAMVDCAGRLEFVVREERDFPHKLQIYGKYGEMVADTIVDGLIHKIQFVDPESGNLVATAESPAIGANISMVDLKVDDFKGDILPWGMHFEEGGFANATSLMDEDWRWVTAAAVQVSAVRQPMFGKTPVAHKVLFFVMWAVATLSVLAAVLVCYLLYCLVYPKTASTVENKWLRLPGKEMMRHGYPATATKYG